MNPCLRPHRDFIRFSLPLFPDEQGNSAFSGSKKQETVD
jgi:hypothetical protein